MSFSGTANGTLMAMGKTASPRDQLKKLSGEVREAYIANKRVMSFGEYLDLVAAKPYDQLRAAPQYMRDCFDFFGNESVEYSWGTVRRFRLFDIPWADGRDKLIGQEEVQNRVYRALGNFVNEGVSNKLILLHGPNGSAKSTFVRCIGRALQHYSTLDEGALYRINWVFPSQKLSKSGIGFSGSEIAGAVDASESYAYLPDELVDAKLVDELHDHPIFLIPKKRRGPLIEDFFASAGKRPDFVLSDYIQHGRLSHKNRAIFEALLASYQGDLLKVLRHVQVERFFIRHRYRSGYATVEPQLSVDASERQITADRSIAALPPALQSISLFEYGGPLVAANRGMIEYSDLLKRPLEAYKYLISTVEKSSVTLSTASLFLDLCFIGTSNEIHLAAFKEIPEWLSFRGRLELVRVPYLLDFQQEQQIYADKLREAASSKHIAPHCAYVAALWAVLTRMRKPVADKYPAEVSELVAKIAPIEKAELYATGKVPDGLSGTEKRELAGALDALWHESDAYPNYEGRTGASARAMQTVLFNAANSSKFTYVSPLAILEEIAEIVKQTSVYSFLKQEELPGGYHAHSEFIAQVRSRLVDRIDDEVRGAMGLVEDVEYERLFDHYVNHVMHWTKKEKVRNPTTGAFEEPDAAMMKDIETTIGVADDSDQFRHALIGRIGAWSLDHPNQKPVYHIIFADHFKKLRDAYYAKAKKLVGKGIEELRNALDDGSRVSAGTQRTIDALIDRFGYSRESARDAVALLARTRYAH